MPGTWQYPSPLWHKNMSTSSAGTSDGLPFCDLNCFLNSGIYSFIFSFDSLTLNPVPAFSSKILKNTLDLKKQTDNIHVFVCMSSSRGSNGSQYVDIPGSSPSLPGIAKIVPIFRHKYCWEFDTQIGLQIDICMKNTNFYSTFVSFENCIVYASY